MFVPVDPPLLVRLRPILLSASSTSDQTGDTPAVGASSSPPPCRASSLSGGYVGWPPCRIWTACALLCCGVGLGDSDRRAHTDYPKGHSKGQADYPFLGFGGLLTSLPQAAKRVCHY